MSRLMYSAIALALATSVHLPSLACPDSENPQNNDPYKPRPRSKGEKARNRRYRK